MIYDSWKVKRNRILSFWAIFSPFTPVTTQKIKIWKNEKMRVDIIIILHKHNKNHDHMLYCSWDMMHDRCYFLLFYQPKNLKEKIKKKKNGWRYYHLTRVYQKLWSDVQFLRYAVRWTDKQMGGRMDGWMDEFLIVFKFLIVDLFN